jgi:hypothetical protein
MAEAALNVIGLVLGAAGIGLMVPGLLPQKPQDPSHTTVVKVGAGMTGTAAEIKDHNMGGNFPVVTLWDSSGRKVGQQTKGDNIDSGGWKQVDVSHENGMDGVPGEYVAISAGGNDAVCINFITVQWPDGRYWGWLGDVGQMCGGIWYHSDTTVANFQSNSQNPQANNNATSSCTWVDGDASNGLKFQGFGMHIIDFSSDKSSQYNKRAEQYKNDTQTMCSSAPRFKMYEQISKDTKLPIFWPKLNYNEDQTDADLNVVKNNPGKYPDQISKRGREAAAVGYERRGDAPTPPNHQGPPDSSRFSNVIVKSDRERHSAKELCDSKTSMGPDFVSLREKLFCDMKERKTYPLCDEQKKTLCFDLKTDKLVGSGKRDDNTPVKTYGKTLKWGNTQ